MGDIDAVPVCHGLGGQKILKQAREAIGAEEFRMILRCAEKQLLPPDEEHMAVIRQGGDHVEMVVRAFVAERNARQAKYATSQKD